MLNQYDIIRIVSLPSRTDRRKQMVREFRKVGFIGPQDTIPTGEGHLAFFDAVQTPHAAPFRSAGSRGAFLSHLAILQEAARNRQSVLILQDDCAFYPEINGYWVPTGCDVFYGGWMLDDPADEARLHDAHIIGAHFMGFSARAAYLAADYLGGLLDPRGRPDPLAAATEPNFNPAARPPIDGSLVWFRRAYPGLMTVFHKLGEQRPSRTDIGNRSRLDRYPVLAPFVTALRRVKKFIAMDLKGRAHAG